LKAEEAAATAAFISSVVAHGTLVTTSYSTNLLTSYKEFVGFLGRVEEELSDEIVVKRNKYLSGRVVKIDPLGGLGLDELVVDKQLGSGDIRAESSCGGSQKVLEEVMEKKRKFRISIRRSTSSMNENAQ